MHKLDYLLLAAFLLIAGVAVAQSSAQKKLLFGVAYYDEYMPYERLEKDIAMVKALIMGKLTYTVPTWLVRKYPDRTR